MDIQGSATLRGTQEQVFKLMQDPEVLRRCVPGCEKLEATGPDQFRASLSIGVAAIKGKYTGEMSMTDQRPPSGYSLNVEGKGTPGWVKAVMKFELEPQGEQTVVHYKIDAQVGGLIAAVGQRMLGGVAKMMLGDMFKQLQAEAEALRT